MADVTVEGQPLVLDALAPPFSMAELETLDLGEVVRSTRPYEDWQRRLVDQRARERS